MPVKKRILFCHCRGERINDVKLSRIRDCLQKLPVEVTELHDLCGLVVLQKENIQHIFTGSDEIMIIACSQRSVQLLLAYAGVPLPTGEIHFLNNLELSEDEIRQEVEAFCAEAADAHPYTVLNASSNWPSWYPLVDYARCSACGQCADFCLFGVYEKNEKGIKVIHPRGCKNNCPACARICPQTAIVFPKYKQGGAIGGSDDFNEIAEQSRQSHDIKEILGNDIYAALEQRKRKRQSVILGEAMRKAQEEREQAINEHQKNRQ